MSPDGGLFLFPLHLKTWISSQTVTRTVLQGFQLSLSEIKIEIKMSCTCRQFLLTSCFLRCLCWMCAYLMQKLPKPMQPLPDTQDIEEKSLKQEHQYGKGLYSCYQTRYSSSLLLAGFVFVFFLPVLPTHKWLLKMYINIWGKVFAVLDVFWGVDSSVNIRDGQNVWVEGK